MIVCGRPRSGVHDRVFAELTVAGRWVSTAELAARLHFAPSYLREVLRRLVADGLVVQDGVSRTSRGWRAV